MTTLHQQLLNAFKRHKPERVPSIDKLREVNRVGNLRWAEYDRRGVFAAGNRVLDVGCAWGALCCGMPPEIEYVGLDVNLPSLRIAADVFGERGTFLHIDVRADKYNGDGKLNAVTTAFQLPPETFDAALCLSLFTRFTDSNAVRRYLLEVRRCLAPGGRLLATWFRSPPNTHGGTPRRFVYREQEIRELLDEWTWLDDWGGRTTRHDDRWHTLVEKPAA